MRNIVLFIVALLLIALLLFLILSSCNPIGTDNQAPVAVDDSFTTEFEMAVSGSIVMNDSDPDNDISQLTVSQQSDPSSGVLTLDASGNFTYSPNVEFSGNDQFTYEICDPEPLCATATVFITVNPEPVETVPVPQNDAAETMLNTAVTIDVLNNDTGGNLTINSINPAPANGTAVPAENKVTYTPNNDVSGDDTFGYEVCNSAGCATATVIVTVYDFQLNDDAYSVSKNTTLTENVRGNDLGDPVINTTPTILPANGTIILQADGQFTFTPNADVTGMDGFTYAACSNSQPAHCATANVTITVGGPTANPDEATTMVNTAVSGNVLGNDLGDGLKATPISNDKVVLGEDGNFTYTPMADFTGIDTFTYEVCDSSTLCDTAVVTIEITGEDDDGKTYHTVIYGEWLLQIARCYGTTAKAIRMYNHIPNPNLIYPEQKLHIPNAGSTGPIQGPDCVEYHVVAEGETLEGIAALYNMTDSELARVNGLYIYHSYYYGTKYGGHTKGSGHWYQGQVSGHGYYYYKDIYVGQKLIIPRPVPDYMQPNP